ASAELMDSLPGNSISTFGGNPISSAGALATIRYMIDHDTQGNSKRMGDRLVAHLQPAVDASATVAELRGRGLMQALETVQPGTLEPNVEAAGQIMEQARAAGLLIGKGGLYGNVLRIAPPMTVTEEEVDKAAEILVACIEALD
ncbi:MAG: aspartate aminotransferase family protein, partial [Actinobacteria bacterium]|nr:aspartate aminotransferase family protein [Actinomycetota bacterium]